ASVTTPTLPAAPSDVGMTADSVSGIQMSATPISSNEDGFKLYRSTDGVNYSNIKILAGNVTSFSDYQRSPGTTYYYQVLAYTNEIGRASSRETSDTTSAPPAAQRNAAATPRASTQ